MVVIKGVEESSFIDYPDKVSLVVFTAGCNFHCHYCHNPELVNPSPPFMEEEEVLHVIEEKKEWLDGVVISGGEPTLHPDLPIFIKKIKELGLLVKLDTNGSHPGMLEELIQDELIDYVAMDVKAPLGKYEEVTQMSCDKSKIAKSINIIRNSDVQYEFRTTIVPELLEKEDIMDIAYLLEGSDLFVLQDFRSGKTLDEEYEGKQPYLKPEMQHFKRILKPFFKRVEIR